MKNTNNPHVNAWIQQVTSKLNPKNIVLIDGSAEETKRMNAELVKDGTFTQLNEKEYPNSYWAVSDPTDVARVEDRTFICSADENDAGPTNNWFAPSKMYELLDALMVGCMEGRTMYVVPYLMGPNGSSYSKVGFELTDSAYVVANMKIMARVGKVALDNLDDNSTDFVKGIHSIGTLNPNERYIAHFPDDNTIISFNSNYGGNALQGKKCFALRIASTIGRKEGWLAEHMLIVGITNPEGKKHYVCAAFPSACGKTNLAMLIPPKSYLDKGWKVETVGDDIAWLNFGKDGRLYAINPEAGFFGVAPGTSEKTNPNALLTCRANTIFTNTAYCPDTKVPWWEGLSKEPPEKLIDWRKREWTPSCGMKAAHANARFTAPASQCPCIDPDWENPNGVPISAIIFGGRRPRTVPLVFEARNWTHGTFVGAMMASETTAAASGKVGELRRDPMAMLPFIGYHAGDYLAHWLHMGAKGGNKMPKIFHVNWFRTNDQGDFLWPGFGDNLRVLEWILNRVDNKVQGVESAIGLLPKASDINTNELNIHPEVLDEIISVRPSDWRFELESQMAFLEKIGSKLPKEILAEHETLRAKLNLN
jgi:phosphoenolpyruvate carboxykinase (GTP)